MDPQLQSELFKQFYSFFIEITGEIITKDVVWYLYKEKVKSESCAVCNIRLITDDHCRISDCSHEFHADCIARYCDRVEDKCPICKTEVKDKIIFPK